MLAYTTTPLMITSRDTAPSGMGLPPSASVLGRVRNRALTDGIVGDAFGRLTREQLLAKLAEADIAFAEVNSMDDLAKHPHLRHIEVDTPNGRVSYPAPAAIVVGEDRHYGKVPAIGERTKR